MPNYPVRSVHGYSDAGRSFAGWGARLRAAGYDAREVRVANWRSLAADPSRRARLQHLIGLARPYAGPNEVLWFAR